MPVTNNILMIAGPNGAGKTTFVLELINNSPKVYEFINADEIAKGLAPLHPETMALSASKLMIKRFLELLKAHKNFAFETTASGTNYVKHLKSAKKYYQIHLVFLWLKTPEQAIGRVTERVKQGGHSIPEETIRRRYVAGIKNLLKHYLPLADTALIIDNSQEEVPRKLIAEKSINKSLNVVNKHIWRKIEEGSI